MIIKIQKQQGFVALILTLTVSGILLALVATAAIESASYFDQAMRKEYRAMNYYFAGDCLDQAILMLAHDYFFTLSSPLFIPHFQCEIISIEENGDQRKITARGIYQKAAVYRQATVRLLTHVLDVIKIE